MAETLLFNALREALDEEMARDSAVFVLGEDVGQYGGSYKVTKDLYNKYGELRVLDTPIAENSFTGMAVGAAMTGLRPVIEGMNMGFLLLAFNQISNNAGMLRYTSGGNFKMPMVIRGPGGVGRQLGAEHSQRLEAYFQAVPGLKIVACSTPYNAKGLLKSAIRDDNPVLFFEHVLLYNLKENLPETEYLVPLDKAEIVRSGKDVTIVTYSPDAAPRHASRACTGKRRLRSRSNRPNFSQTPGHGDNWRIHSQNSQSNYCRGVHENRRHRCRTNCLNQRSIF